MDDVDFTPFTHDEAALHTVRTPDGLQLACEVHGEGPTVLLVHAWALSQRMWRRQAAALVADGFQVVSFDRRGHGHSTDHGGDFDFDILADDLASVIDQLNLTDVTLVGHSTGAGEAVRYLTRHGDAQVSRLVLLAPITPFLRRTGNNPTGVDASLQVAALEMLAADFPAWVEANAAPFFRPETPADEVREGVEMMLATPVSVAVACMAAVMATDFRADLRGIGLPTLVVHGDNDASAPLPVTGAPTAALAPGAELVVIEGAPHGLFATDAPRVNRLIADFARASRLEGLGAGGMARGPTPAPSACRGFRRRAGR